MLAAVGLIFLSLQGKAVLTSLGSYLMLSAAQKMGLTVAHSLLRHLDTLSADITRHAGWERDLSLPGTDR